jgi:hypothetical protein
LIIDASRKISWNAPPENTAVDESEVGSTGWAGRLIGGASRRVAGRQRRRGTAIGKSKVGSAGRLDG